MREFVVFYAWQSDTLQRFNRHLIRFALNLAAQNISDDSASRLAPTLSDRSTMRIRFPFSSIWTTRWWSRRSAMVGSRTRPFAGSPTRSRSVNTPWDLATSFQNRTQICRPTISCTRRARHSIGFPPRRLLSIVEVRADSESLLRFKASVSTLTLRKYLI
jgi:hypothetical protein